MSGLRVRYLSFDGLMEGVGRSQVLAYVERAAARGVEVELHSFERRPVTPLVRARTDAAGVRWHPHPFGAEGARGGAARVARAALWARTDDVVHARSDLAAGAAVLGRSRSWIWDVRSLWADQRLALGALQAGSPEERVLRRVERSAARGSSAVITLTQAVLPVLDLRHGGLVSRKSHVIATCVDTVRFASTPSPSAEPMQLLLAGTLNRYYDVPLMVELVRELQRRRPARLRVLAPEATPWDDLFDVVRADRDRASPEDMPEAIACSHVGLSVCRDDAGISLTAAMPTKIGEFLASGRPVVVNEKLGDAARLVREHAAGVVLRSGQESVRKAADQLEALLADPHTPRRCRSLAEMHFDLDKAADALVKIYADVAAGRRATATQ